MLTAVLAMTAASPNHSNPVTVAEDTSIHVTLNQALTSNQSRPGDHFEATVSKPIIIADKTIIPQGARVEGVVVDARHSGRLMGRARLQLALQTVEVDGKNYEIRAASAHRVGGNHKKRNIAWIGGGGGGGLLIGALAAGGKGGLVGGAPAGRGGGGSALLSREEGWQPSRQDCSTLQNAVSGGARRRTRRVSTV